MNSLQFIISVLTIASIDTILGIVIYIAYKYFDFKYFSNLEIIQLKEENKYLKQENKKINGTSTDFWSN